MARANPHTLTFSAVDWRTVSSDVDCITTWGAPCVAISVAGSGTLNVMKVDGTTGSISLAGYPAGMRLDLQVNTVYSSSTCPNIIVWQNRVAK